jgi:hypothetical protein
MEQSPAERYYQNQLNRMKSYYERNKDSIAQKRREKRVEVNPEIKGRGKFKLETKEKLSLAENK